MLVKKNRKFSLLLNNILYLCTRIVIDADILLDCL